MNRKWLTIRMDISEYRKWFGHPPTDSLSGSTIEVSIPMADIVMDISKVKLIQKKERRSE